MQEIVTKGLVLRAIDWGEKDKIITIFSLDKGKISVALKGVRQQKSKLKFACMPLCFAEFNLTGKGDILSCIGASEIESFFEITSDYDRIVYASAILEIVDCVTTIDVVNTELFVFIIKSLGQLCDFDNQGEIILSKFILYVLDNAGYGLNFNFCKICGAEFTDGANLNLNSGELCCLDCGGSNNSILLNNQIFESIKLINKLDFDNLNKIKLDKKVSINILKVLLTDFTYRFNKKLKSIKL